MERGAEQPNTNDGDASSEMTGTTSVPGEGATHDYGGLDQHIDQVDLDAASEVGADPPGPLGLDIGGGSGNIGESGEVSE